MTKASGSSTEQNGLQGNEINLLDLILVLARRWRMIASITVIIAIVSSGLAMNRPTVFTSSAKLLLIELIDQRVVISAGSDVKPDRAKIKWGWRPADASIMRHILESTPLRQAVKSNWGGDQYNIQIIQDKQQLGTITVKVEGSRQDATAQIAAAAVKEAAELASRMGLLISPALILDDVLKINNGATMAMRLLEPPTDGAPTKPKRSKIILLSTITGLFCSIFLAFVLEYFKNLSCTDRARLEEVKAALVGKKAHTSSTNVE